MEKTYKRVPFDVELAKKIQSGEVEGKIVTKTGLPVVFCKDYSCEELFIELPEETPRQYDEEGWEIGKTRVQQMLEWEEERQKKKLKFKPFDKVLVKDINVKNSKWSCDIFSHVDTEENGYVLLSGFYRDCPIIPYEGNEHLVGTNNNPY